MAMDKPSDAARATRMTVRHTTLALSPADYRLAIHIGLPKTATSFLQHAIFAQSDRIRFFHKNREPEITRSTVQFLRSQDESINVLNGETLSTEFVNVLSNENITIAPLGIWRKKGIVGPDFISMRLDSLARQLFSKSDAFKVIVTIRRQDRWLASRYAESAKLMMKPSQEDFQTRVEDIIGNGFSGNGVWLNYHRILAELTRFFSRDHILVLMQEDLETDPTRWTEKLESFLGVGGLTHLITNLSPEAARRRNILSRKPGKWRLKNHVGEIRVTKETSARIMLRYGESNQRLAMEYCVDGSAYGYY